MSNPLTQDSTAEDPLSSKKRVTVRGLRRARLIGAETCCAVPSPVKVLETDPVTKKRHRGYVWVPLDESVAEAPVRKRVTLRGPKPTVPPEAPPGAQLCTASVPPSVPTLAPLPEMGIRVLDADASTYLFPVVSLGEDAHAHAHAQAQAQALVSRTVSDAVPGTCLRAFCLGQLPRPVDQEVVPWAFGTSHSAGFTFTLPMLPESVQKQLGEEIQAASPLYTMCMHAHATSIQVDITQLASSNTCWAVIATAKSVVGAGPGYIAFVAWYRFARYLLRLCTGAVED